VTLLEVPRQLRDLRDVGLEPEDGTLRVYPERHHVDQGVDRVPRHLRAVEERGEAVHVGYETEQLPPLLGFDHRAYHAQIVADMEGAGGFDAGQYS